MPLDYVPLRLKTFFRRIFEIPTRGVETRSRREIALEIGTKILARTTVCDIHELLNLFAHTSRIFCPRIAIFFQFWVYLSTIQAEQIINLLLLNNFYPVIMTGSKRKRRIIVYGLVSRYGPQSVASASGVSLFALKWRATYIENFFVPKLQYFFSFEYI